MPTRVTIYSATTALNDIQRLTPFVNRALHAVPQDEAARIGQAMIDGNLGLLTHGAEYEALGESKDTNPLALVRYRGEHSTAMQQLTSLVTHLINQDPSDRRDSQLLILRLCIASQLHIHKYIDDSSFQAMLDKLRKDFPVASTTEVVVGSTLAAPAFVGWAAFKTLDIAAAAVGAIILPIVVNTARYVTTKPVVAATSWASSKTLDVVAGSFWSSYGYLNFDHLLHLVNDQGGHLALHDMERPLALCDAPRTIDGRPLLEDTAEETAAARPSH